MSHRMITSYFASPPAAVDGPGERQRDDVDSEFRDLLALAEPPAKRARGRPKGSSNEVVQDGCKAPSSTAECPGACVDEASNLSEAVDLETGDMLDSSTPQKRRRGKYNSSKDPKYLAVAQEAVDRALGNGNFSSTVIPSLAWIIDHYSRSFDYRFNRWTLTRLIEEARKNGGRLQPYETALTHNLERQLKNFIVECSKTGMPLPAKDIKGMAYDLARFKDSNTKFKATSGWWKSFKARHPDLRIQRVSIQRSRQELLELVRSLSVSSEDHVSEEASSSLETKPPQNSDEVPAGTSESVQTTMEEEDLVKTALLVNAALSGYTGGKLKRCHLVSYLINIKKWDKNFPWQAKRAQLFCMTVEFIRAFPEIANSRPPSAGIVTTSGSDSNNVSTGER